MSQFKEPIIHVGWPRCASTFLNTRVFSNLRSYKRLDDNDYTDMSLFYLADINPESPVHALAEQNDVILGGGHFVTYEIPLPWRKYGERVRQDIFIANITALFKERGKLLFVIRRQDKIAESFLRRMADLMDENYMFVDYPVTASAYEDSSNIKVYKKANLKNRYGTMLTNSFDYYDVLKRITAHIPKDRLKVLPYEDLEENPQKFYAELGKFLGEDLSAFAGEDFEKINASSDQEEIRNPALRKLSRHKLSFLIPGPIRRFARRIMAKKTAMSPEFRTHLMKIYADNNRRLAEEFNLDLKQYGYY